MITIKELAELAGTSRGTVDRVLNGRGKVNPILERQIKALAAEHAYHSNPFAKALANGQHQYTIGAVINSIDNKFFDDVLRGIHDTADSYRAYGINLHIKEIKGYCEAEQLEALEEILAENPVALAITPMDTPAIAARLSAADVPIVTLNSDLRFDGKLAFIGCDYLNSGKLSGDLASLALPNGGTVCIITGSFHMMGHNQRIDGFRAATSENPDIHIVDVSENGDDNQISFDITQKVIARYHPDLIYFCAAGTEGGVDAVRASGEAIKVIVCDDIEPMRRHLADGSILGIVTQQPYRQGSGMVEMLYNYLVTGKKPHFIHNFTENQVKLRSSKEYDPSDKRRCI